MDLGLAGQLQKGNLLFFEKPVNVNLGRLLSIKHEGTIIYQNIVEISTYGIHLIECDPKTKVKLIDINAQLLTCFGFSYAEKGNYSIPIPQRKSIINIKQHPNEPEKGWLIKIINPTGGFNLHCIHYVHTLQNLYASLCPGYCLKLIN